MITQRDLKEILGYDPETGIFIWKKQLAPRGKVGSVAGCPDKNGRCAGRVSIRIHGKLYLAHRLAWFYVYGEWPKLIDHIDGNPSNNRISNLRLATNAQNGWNSGPRSHNTSGFKGVRYDATRKKWSARLCVNGEFVLTKRFSRKQDAIDAVKRAIEQYHGEFARVA